MTLVQDIFISMSLQYWFKYLYKSNITNRPIDPDKEHVRSMNPICTFHTKSFETVRWREEISNYMLSR